MCISTSGHYLCALCCSANVKFGICVFRIVFKNNKDDVSHVNLHSQYEWDVQQR